MHPKSFLKLKHHIQPLRDTFHFFSVLSSMNPLYKVTHTLTCGQLSVANSPDMQTQEEHARLHTEMPLDRCWEAAAREKTGENQTVRERKKGRNNKGKLHFSLNRAGKQNVLFFYWQTFISTNGLGIRGRLFLSGFKLTETKVTCDSYSLHATFSLHFLILSSTTAFIITVAAVNVIQSALGH